MVVWIGYAIVLKWLFEIPPLCLPCWEQFLLNIELLLYELKWFIGFIVYIVGITDKNCTLYEISLVIEFNRIFAKLNKTESVSRNLPHRPTVSKGFSCNGLALYYAVPVYYTNGLELKTHVSWIPINFKFRNARVQVWIIYRFKNHVHFPHIHCKWCT